MADLAEDVITVWHLLNPKTLMEITGPTLWARLPWALASVAVVFGGILIVWLLVKVILASCCFKRKYQTRYIYVDGENKEFIKDRHRMQSFAHVIVETLFFIGIFFVIWISSYVAGFNLLTSSLLTVGVGLVATYMFAMALQNVGAGYWIYVTDKIEEGQYISFPQMGPEIHGIVAEMHPLFILLQRENTNGDNLVEIQIPMTQALTTIVIRDFKKEAKTRKTLEKDPDSDDYNWDHLWDKRETPQVGQPLFRPITVHRRNITKSKITV